MYTKLPCISFADILIIAGSSSMGISIIVMDIAAVLFQPECLLCK